MKSLLFVTLTSAFLLAQIVHADTGALYITPAREYLRVGEQVRAHIFVDSGGGAVSAAEARVVVDPTLLKIVSFSREGSILSQWAREPDLDARNGVFEFSGWAGETYRGKSGFLVSILLEAQAPGVALVSLESGAVLSSEKPGSNVARSLRSATYTIQSAREMPEALATTTVSTEEPVIFTSLSDLVSPLPPRFVRYPREVEKGERIVLYGEAMPDSVVEVFFEGDTREVVAMSVRSALDGSFTTISEEGARGREYRVSARIKGHEESHSESIRIQVAQSGLVAAVSALGIDTVSSTSLFLVGLLVLSVVGFWFFVWRIPRKDE